LVAAIDGAGPAVFVREKLAVPGTPGADATTRYDPAMPFAVNATAVATPEAFVVAVFTPPANVPLGPLAGGVKVTTTPLIGLKLASLTVATSGAAKGFRSWLTCSGLLGSTSQDVEYLAQNRQAPREVVTLLSSNVSTASTTTESAAAVRALQAVQQADPTLAPLVKNAVNDLPVRLYIQIRSDSDRPTAEQVQRLFSANDMTVPGIELVSVGPAASEIRYFHSTDKPKAEELAQKLKSAGIATDAKDASGFARLINSNVPQKQLELWLAPGAKVSMANV
jgi:hypothetical protein